MRKIRAGSVFLSLFFLLLTPCYSTVLEDEQAKISIWYPDTWTMQSDDDANAVLITDPRKDVVVIYTILESDTLGPALKAVETQLRDMAGNLRALDDPEEDTLNGMKCVLLDVTGTIKNTPIRIGVVIIFTPGRKTLLVAAVTSRSNYTKYDNLIADIISKITPLK
jgi:hypothetical protein